MRSRFTLMIDRPHRLIIIRLHDLSHADGAAPDLIDALATLEQAWLYDVLFDFRRYEVELSRDYLAFLTQKWNAMTHGRDQDRCMALVSRDYDLKRRLQGMTDVMPGRAIKIFEDFDEALDWIKGGSDLCGGHRLLLAS
ncbi:MAG TPA: hypothetical protein VN042_07870 [Asticcacaulis sp.]|nr:hypothetical protein [Asticcacaulis sp.]